ncbi:hypothetical protein AVEN_88978-1 [Araneus ventricosus]|uniref:Uncharacterized protein n=1 Tax=Araneus ventricosus TaxID=182803 RepID=A0A4Y2DKD4_ARAVE|nr:hypothetical protein AVEN_88978-1 [Araneus ventricosus]
MSSHSQSSDSLMHSQIQIHGSDVTDSGFMKAVIHQIQDSQRQSFTDSEFLKTGSFTGQVHGKGPFWEFRFYKEADKFTRVQVP